MYPAVHPVRPREIREAASGEAAARRRGRGHDLYNLRAYRAGDEPHLIHWPTTAKSGSLMVRELEEEATEDTRIVLTGTGAADGERLERALSEAASLAVHLLRGGTGVELAGAAGSVPLGPRPGPGAAHPDRAGALRPARPGRRRRVRRGRLAPRDPHQPGLRVMAMPLVLRIALYLLVADGLFALYLAEFLGVRGVLLRGGAPRGGLAPPAAVGHGRASSRAGRAPRAPRGAGLGGGRRLPHRQRPRRPGEAPPLPGPLQARDAPERAGFAHGRVSRVLHARRGLGVGVRRGIPLRVRRLRRAAQLDRAPPAPGEREPRRAPGRGPRRCPRAT